VSIHSERGVELIAGGRVNRDVNASLDKTLLRYWPGWTSLSLCGPVRIIVIVFRNPCACIRGMKPSDLRSERGPSLGVTLHALVDLSLMRRNRGPSLD
jgi:hypothetical protein